MKKTIFSMFTILCFSTFFGQTLFRSVDISSLAMGSANTINALSTQEIIPSQDSILIEVNLTDGSVTPDENDTHVDTLVLQEFLSRLYTIENTNDEFASMKCYNRFSSFEFSINSLGDAASYNGAQEFTPSQSGFNLKFVEGQTDTLVLLNTSNQDIYIRLFQLKKTLLGHVISDVAPDLLNQDNILTITNPVKDKLLTINFLSDLSIDLELISLEGQLIKRKTVSPNDNLLDLSELDAGMYLIREVSSNSNRLIMVE